jgi:hypothetical protein
MLNFGPAAMTWEGVNLLVNGGFESWSSGNANNWTYYTNELIWGQNNLAHSGNSCVSMYQSNNSAWGYVYQLISPVNHLVGKTLTCRAYIRGNIGNNKFALCFTKNDEQTYSNYFVSNNNWTLLSMTGNVYNNSDYVLIAPRFANATPDNNTMYVDDVELVEGPYTLGKTFGGGTIAFDEQNFTGLYSKNLTTNITGGSGVLHMFQWNNSISLPSSNLYNYGRLTIACNNMTIKLDHCKLYYSSGMSFGQYQQQPMDIKFTFKKSPVTGNVVTIT